MCACAEYVYRFSHIFRFGARRWRGGLFKLLPFPQWIIKMINGEEIEEKKVELPHRIEERESVIKK